MTASSFDAPPPLLISPGRLPLRDAVRRVQLAEESGVRQVWVSQTATGHDAGTVATAYASATTTVHVGTAVIPVSHRNPVSMAQLSASLADLSGGRFTLGLGAGHSFINEFVLGRAPVPALPAMREYLTIVREFLTEPRVTFQGKHYSARAAREATGPVSIPIYVGALRGGMIRLAVEEADGLLLWMCPPAYIAEHVVPQVTRACREVGRDPAGFPIIAGVETHLTDDPASRYELLAPAIGQYAMFPSYRHVLTASGFAGQLAGRTVDKAMLEELTVVGDADDVRSGLDRYRLAGAVPMPSTAIDDPGVFRDFLEVVRTP